MDTRPALATMALLEAVKAVLVDLGRDLRDAHTGAVEVAEDLVRLIGPGQGACPCAPPAR